MNKQWYLIVLFAAACVTLSGQTSLTTISVLVTSSDGRPVPQADVTVFTGPPNVSMSTYQTKGDGIAIFRTKSEAGLIVVAKADGFRSGETEIDGRNATSTRLTLQPARRFLGRVIDSGGRPVASAKVVALVSEGARRSFYDRPTWSIRGQGGTNR